MAILSDTKIFEAFLKGEIVIKPFDRKNLGPNSYDVHIDQYIGTFKHPVLDAREEQEIELHRMKETGFRLDPGVLYLASTIEYTESHKHVPYLDGKSSIGRLGISIHATAGRGDCNFSGYFTLEISVVHPVIIYPGMPIGQLTYHTVEGDITNPYGTKSVANYNNNEPKPQASRMFKNFPLKTPVQES